MASVIYNCDLPHDAVFGTEKSISYLKKQCKYEYSAHFINIIVNKN